MCWKRQAGGGLDGAWKEALVKHTVSKHYGARAELARSTAANAVKGNDNGSRERSPVLNEGLANT
jgi:hypothetical protein